MSSIPTEIEVSDESHNRAEFEKVRFECIEFPKIFGRIMVSDFAVDGGKGLIKIGRNVVINSSVEANPIGGFKSIFVFKHGDGIIEIEDGAGISNAIIAAYEHVYIGKDAAIGAGAKIFDTDFHPLDFKERMLNINIPHRPVRIEHGAFIGADSIILKGVTVGEFSVVGAGSVVAKSIPPCEIWGGNPAKFIKKLERKADAL